MQFLYIWCRQLQFAIDLDLELKCNPYMHVCMQCEIRQVTCMCQMSKVTCLSLEIVLLQMVTSVVSFQKYDAYLKFFVIFLDLRQDSPCMC